jgi:hypothetical protein
VSTKVDKVKPIKDEAGKTRLVRKRGYVSKRQYLKADRDEKRWRAKDKATGARVTTQKG